MEENNLLPTCLRCFVSYKGEINKTPENELWSFMSCPQCKTAILHYNSFQCKYCFSNLLVGRVNTLYAYYCCSNPLCVSWKIKKGRTKHEILLVHDNRSVFLINSVDRYAINPRSYQSRSYTYDKIEKNSKLFSFLNRLLANNKDNL